MELSTKTLLDIKREADSLAASQLSFLEDLVGPDSGTGNVEGNLAVTGTILEALTRLPNLSSARAVFSEAEGIGRHLVVRIGEADAPLKVLAMAHLDTVFAPGESAKHPFRIDGDKVYGLGAADCKGGVAVSMYGAAIALKLGLWPRELELTLLYTSDEETGSATARPLFEREAKRADYALVFEPARGENGIITARKGCALGSLTVEGREAHALSAYLSGADANLALAKAVVAVCEAGDPAAGRFFNFGTINGGRHADIVSDKAEAGFFVTFSDDEELALINRTLEIAVASPGAPGCRLASTLDVSFPPLVPTPMSRAAYERVKTLGAALGLELPEQSSPGSSDGCWVASHGVPVIDALGPYMYDIHTTREAARISSFPERTALFAAIIATMADWPIRASKTGA